MTVRATRRAGCPDGRVLLWLATVFMVLAQSAALSHDHDHDHGHDEQEAQECALVLVAKTVSLPGCDGPVLPRLPVLVADSPVFVDGARPGLSPGKTRNRSPPVIL